MAAAHRKGDVWEGELASKLLDGEGESRKLSEEKVKCLIEIVIEVAGINVDILYDCLQGGHGTQAALLEVEKLQHLIYAIRVELEVEIKHETGIRKSCAISTASTLSADTSTQPLHPAPQPPQPLPQQPQPSLQQQPLPPFGLEVIHDEELGDMASTESCADDAVNDEESGPTLVCKADTHRADFYPPKKFPNTRSSLAKTQKICNTRSSSKTPKLTKIKSSSNTQMFSKEASPSKRQAPKTRGKTKPDVITGKKQSKTTKDGKNRRIPGKKNTNRNKSKNTVFVEQEREPSNGLAFNTHGPCVCERCGKVFKSINTLRCHIRLHQEKDADQSHSCPDCGKQFKLKASLNCHLKIHSPLKEFQCTFCGKCFSKRHVLVLHMRTHNGEKPYSCSVCHKTFSFVGNLRRHERIHTGSRPWKCSYCDKSFNQSDILKAHLRIHTGEKPFQCSYCGESFSQKNFLNSHSFRAHSQDIRFPPSALLCECSICGKQFLNEHDLNHHMVSHTGVKPYQCSLCPKRFSRKISLNIHFRQHTGTRPFQCDLCGKSFTRKSSLNIHMDQHNGVDYSCDICYRSFNNRANLIRHKRTHSGVKPFACEVCGRDFSQKATLDLHMWTHRTDKRFTCDVCGKGFNDKRNFKAHSKKHGQSTSSNTSPGQKVCRNDSSTSPTSPSIQGGPFSGDTILQGQQLSLGGDVKDLLCTPMPAAYNATGKLQVIPQEFDLDPSLMERRWSSSVIPGHADLRKSLPGEHKTASDSSDFKTVPRVSPMPVPQGSTHLQISGLSYPQGQILTHPQNQGSSHLEGQVSGYFQDHELDFSQISGSAHSQGQTGKAEAQPTKRDMILDPVELQTLHQTPPSFS